MSSLQIFSNCIEKKKLLGHNHDVPRNPPPPSPSGSRLSVGVGGKEGAYWYIGGGGNSCYRQVLMLSRKERDQDRETEEGGGDWCGGGDWLGT